MKGRNIAERRVIFDSDAQVRVDGKVAIVTGANGGIGRATALELARRGARVIMGCRNVEAGIRVRDEIVAETGNANVTVAKLDLGSLQSVRRFAQEINDSEERLDFLINNAGVFSGERRQTDDGFELDFGVNHLGHFLLTYLLLEKLVKSAPSRVVTLSSKAHEYSDVDLDDLQLTKSRWSALKAYGRSKTANVLFSSHLARLLEGTGVTTYCVHPGVIGTGLGRDFEGSFVMKCFNCVWKLFNGRLMTPLEGAQTTLYCCLSPDVAHASGKYYSNCHEKRAKSYAISSLTGEKLWRISAELCHVAPTVGHVVSNPRFRSEGVLRLCLV